ncbi:hypothetical protein EV363DRAFT_1300517 [Boletus edulis]|nr:hypothetical protein EV363DRAFT_1300517 [Boletus edulis]
MAPDNPPLQGNAKGKRRDTSTTTATRSRGGRGQSRGLSSRQPAIPAKSQPAVISRPQEPTSTTTDSVKWEKFPHLTDLLIAWLFQHPADRVILFNDKVAGENAPAGSKASGRTKKDICITIAEHLFKEDENYKDLYAASTGTDKFPNSVLSRLATYIHPPFYC